MTKATHTLPEEALQGTYIVVPAYNEAACIERVLRGLGAAYPNVVVVDDGSTDGTYAIASRLTRYTLRHRVNRGQGAALQTGIEFALRRGARYVVTFDADGQHDPADIAVLLAPIVAGECEITLGSRFLGDAKDIPRLRRLVLRVAVGFTRLLTRLPLTDVHNGLRAFSRRAARQMRISMDGMAHASEVLDRVRQLHLQFREVPVHIRYTSYSLAKGQSLRGSVRILIHYIVGKVAR